MNISMIVALSSNRVIGIENSLPWKLSADMAWFKKNTLNKTILLGRKTWESLPLRPLPGRKHILLTHNDIYQPLGIAGQKIEGVKIVNSIEEAIAFAETELEKNEELMVIGGATIYKLMLPYCNKLYITGVKCALEGDAWFPEIDTLQWKDTFTEAHFADDKNQYDFDFLVKERVKVKVKERVNLRE